jgi:thioredoxin 1
MPGMLTGELADVTDETFAQEVLAHEGAVLVDFWAQWCPPCHMIAPVLAEIARDHAESLAIRKLNADDNPLTAARYGVLALPTLILFVDGQPTRTLVGARPKRKLLAELGID